jgi:DNA-binding transcriptional ArsR family regulator
MSDPLSLTLSALADPPGGRSSRGLHGAKPRAASLRVRFSISQPAISKHLKVPERAGFICRGREARWRPCQLEAAPLRDVASLLENYWRFWEESFDRLDAYLQDLQKGDLDAPGNC